MFTITNPNPAGGVFYTLDGSDPRDCFGNVATNALPVTNSISINRSTVVRARAKSGQDWSDLASAAFTADQDFSKLLFTEIMFHPRKTNDVPVEYVELKNVGEVTLYLSGLELANPEHHDGDPLPFGAKVDPGEFYLLVNRVAAFQEAYPDAPFSASYTNLELSNEGQRLVLRSPSSGAIAVDMTYATHAPWRVVPDNHGYFPTNRGDDGIGFSLVRVSLDPALDPADFRTWRASAHRFGSPGADDPPSTVPPIYINELLTRASSSLHDSVEFYNPNHTNVDLGGWWLSDERNRPYRYKIPPKTIIPALGYLVIDDTRFNATTNGFSFSADGDRCYLFSGDTNGVLTGYSDGLEFAGSDKDVTFGRYITRDGVPHFPQQKTRTLGSANSGPTVGPIVISEIMYDAGKGDPSQWVEISNIGTTPVQLWDPDYPDNPWGLGHPYWVTQLPRNLTIAARGRILVVLTGDPAALRARYNIPTSVPMFALDLKLDRCADQLEIYKPSGTVDGLNPRYVAVDEVSFTDHYPWPAGAAGCGCSLERIGLGSYGDDPWNWRPSPTVSSPGRTNSANLPPQVWAGADRTNFVGQIVTLQGVALDDAWAGAELGLKWSRVSGPAAVTFTPATEAQTQVTFTQPGHYVLRLTASDGVFNTNDDLTVEVVIRPFDQWLKGAFTAAELTNSAISGPGADPDSDGRPNLVEYFFGSPPKVKNSTALLHPTIVDDVVQIRWTQVSNPSDVIATPEYADEVEGPWFSGEGTFEIRAVPGAVSGTDDVTLKFLHPAQAMQTFVRLKLSLRD